LKKTFLEGGGDCAGKRKGNVIWKQRLVMQGKGIRAFSLLGHGGGERNQT